MNLTPENKNSPKFPTYNSVSVGQMVTIYVLMVVLSQMKQRLGLEAVLEYIEKSKSNLEKDNPTLTNSVKYALTTVNIEKIYKDASYEQEEYKS